MTAFDDMVDALFADAVLAQDAIYTPLGEPAWADPVRVTVRDPESSVVDALDGTDLMDPSALVLRVRRADVPVPAKGDTLTLAAGAVYRIDGESAGESNGRIWRLFTVRVTA